MIESFLKRNWRTVYFFAAILFATLVWPTVYVYWTDKGGDYMRANRLTGTREVYWYGLGEWRTWNSEEWFKADEESKKLKKRLEQKPADNK